MHINLSVLDVSGVVGIEAHILCFECEMRIVVQYDLC